MLVQTPSIGRSGNKSQKCRERPAGSGRFDSVKAQFARLFGRRCLRSWLMAILSMALVAVSASEPALARRPDLPAEPPSFSDSTCVSATGCDLSAQCSGFDCFDTQPEGRGDGLTCVMSGATGKDISDPVRMALGDYQLIETDLDLPGFGPTLRFTRTYRSKSGYDDRVYGGMDGTPQGPIGRNWDHSFNIFLKLFESNPEGYSFHDGTGRADVFALNSNRVTQGQTTYNYYAPVGGGAINRPNFDTEDISMKRPDGSVYLFHAPGLTTTVANPLGGKIKTITDRNGNVTEFTYYADTHAEWPLQLESVTDAGGRFLLFEYVNLEHPTTSTNDRVMLSSVEDYTGRTVTFQYYFGNEQNEEGNFGDLKSVTVDPVVGNDRVWTYAYYEGAKRYENNLKSVKDPRGQIILVNTYSTADGYQNGTSTKSAIEGAEFDAVVRQDYGGDRYDYKYYQRAGTTGESIRVSVNRLGQVRALTFDGLQQLVLRTDFTGTIVDRDAFLTALSTLNGDDSPSGGDGPTSTSLQSSVESYITQNSDSTRKRDAEQGTLAQYDEPRHFETGYQYDIGNATVGLITVVCPPAARAQGSNSYSKGYQSSHAYSVSDPLANGRLISRGRSPHDDDLPAGYGQTDSATITETFLYPDDLGGSECGCAPFFADKYKDGNGNWTFTPRDEHGNLLYNRRGASSSISTDWLSEEEFEYFTTDLNGDHGVTDPPLGEVYRHKHPLHGTTGQRIDKFVYFESDDANLYRAGRLQQMIVDDGGLDLVTSYTYDGFGFLDTVTDPNGNVTEYDYNGHGWLVEVRKYAPSSSTVLSKRTLFYDLNGNLVREDVANLDQDGDVITANPAITTIYDYDVLNKRVRTCREAGVVADGTGTGQLPASQRECIPGSGLNLKTDARFVTEELVYDANDNLVRIVKGEAASGGGVQSGNTVDREYDERNKLFLEIRGKNTASEATTRFDYDLNGNLRRKIAGYKRTDPSNADDWQVTEYWYDGHDRLVQITDPMGNITNYKYDNANNRIEEWVKGASVTDVEPPITGQPAADQGHYLAFTKTTFDRMNRPLTARRYKFTAGSAAPSESDNDELTEWVYNQDSSIQQFSRYVTISGASGTKSTTKYEYDGAHRLKKMTNAEGDTTEYAYDDNGNATAVTEKEYLGNGDDTVSSGTEQVFTRAFTFDALERMLTSIDGAGNEVGYEYDSRGNAVKKVDARGNDTLYEYDSLDRLIKTTRNLYDGGQPDPQGGQPYAEIITQQEWDHSSRLIAQIDDNGNRTSYWYDELHRPVLTRMADGTIHRVGTGDVTWSPPTYTPNFYTSWLGGYDVHANAIAITDANGSVIENSYDINNRLIQRSITPGTGGTAPDGGYAVVGSDSGMPGIEQEVYTYDGLSRVLVARDEDTRVSREYDTLSRLTSETSDMTVWTGLGWQQWNMAYSPLSVEYQYDSRSNVKQITYPDNRIVTQSFDPLSRIETIYEGNGMNPPMIAGYVYHGPGRVKNRIHANDTQVDYSWTGYQGGPGGYGFKQVVGTESRRTDPPGTIFDDRTYSWDRAQNKTAFTNSVSASGPSRNFFYDSASRLVKSQNGGGSEVAEYFLDGVHNRTEVTGSLAAGAQVGSYDMTAATPYDYPVNQYTGTPLDRPVYDLNGNMTGVLAQAGGEMLMMMGIQEGGPGGALQQSIDDDIAAGGLWVDLTSDDAIQTDDVDVLGQFMQMQGGGGGCGEQDPFCQFQRAVEIAYDYRNQMVQYKDLDNLRIHRYHYDCFGRRVAKVMDADSTGYSPVITRYSYGGQASWQVLAEYDAFQPGEDDPLATYVFGGYIDEPIQMRRDFDGGGTGYGVQDFYYHPDELFNVVAITAGQDDTAVPYFDPAEFDEGEVIERTRYGDYGNPTVTDESGSALGDTSTLGNRFAFTGREYDAETEFSYYRTRYLEHAWGRFTTRDPIGAWGDHANYGNALTYVGNDPSKWLDPQGLQRGRGGGSTQVTRWAIQEMKKCSKIRNVGAMKKCLKDTLDVVCLADSSACDFVQRMLDSMDDAKDFDYNSWANKLKDLEDNGGPNVTQSQDLIRQAQDRARNGSPCSGRDGTVFHNVEKDGTRMLPDLPEGYHWREWHSPGDHTAPGRYFTPHKGDPLGPPTPWDGTGPTFYIPYHAPNRPAITIPPGIILST